jgi:hypothetical protein
MDRDKPASIDEQHLISGPGLWLSPWLVFLLSLGVYTLTLPRAITLEDAGLFQMVCHLGGISHPPGYPLFTLVCQPFVQLPFFPADAFAGNFLSALFAAATVGVFHHLCFIMRGRLFAWLASGAYAFSATFWSQAIIIEVYTLSVLMFVLCWWCIQRFVATGNAAHFYLLGFVYGLSLCNHWPLMVLSTPALLVLLWQRLDELLALCRQVRFWVLSILCLLLGLLPYLSLFNPDPVIGVYGGIESIEEFVRYIGRAMYTDGHNVATLDDKISFALWLMKESVSQQGFWSLPLVLAGVVLSVRQNVNRAVFFVTAYLCTTYLLLSMISFDYEYFYRAIFKPYPVIAYLAVAYWFAVGTRSVIDWVAMRADRVVIKPVLVVVMLALVFASNFGANNRAGDTLVEAYGEALLSALPRDAVLFVHGDFEASLLGYLTRVKKVRADIELREWQSLVFQNRLTSAFASEDQKMQAALRYVESSDDEIYSIANQILPHTDMGFVYRFDRGGKQPYQITNEVDQFTGYLLNLYGRDLIVDPHEQYFTFHLLIRLSRLYFGYALQSEEHREEVGHRIQALQSTFPGKLVTLEAMLTRNLVTSGNRGVLLDIASQAASNIPRHATNQSVAVFYEYYGRVLMLNDADSDRALGYFERSLASYPSEENTSICPQRMLAKDLQRTDQWVSQFREVPCP